MDKQKFGDESKKEVTKTDPEKEIKKEDTLSQIQEIPKGSEIEQKETKSTEMNIKSTGIATVENRLKAQNGSPPPAMQPSKESGTVNGVWELVIVIYIILAGLISLKCVIGALGGWIISLAKRCFSDKMQMTYHRTPKLLRC